MPAPSVGSVAAAALNCVHVSRASDGRECPSRAAVVVPFLLMRDARDVSDDMPADRCCRLDALTAAAAAPVGSGARLVCDATPSPSLCLALRSERRRDAGRRGAEVAVDWRAWHAGSDKGTKGGIIGVNEKSISCATLSLSFSLALYASDAALTLSSRVSRRCLPRCQ